MKRVVSSFDDFDDDFDDAVEAMNALVFTHLKDNLNIESYGVDQPDLDLDEFIYRITFTDGTKANVGIDGGDVAEVLEDFGPDEAAQWAARIIKKRINFGKHHF